MLVKKTPVLMVPPVRVLTSKTSPVHVQLDSMGTNAKMKSMPALLIRVVMEFVKYWIMGDLGNITKH